MFDRTKRLSGRIKSGVARGMGFSFLYDTGTMMKRVVMGFLDFPKAEKSESFAQAVKRMKLTEQEVEHRRKNFLTQFFMFLIAAFLLFSYAAYVLFQGNWATGIVGILMSALLGAHALRAHFWAFQIKHRKLGCTLEEWWNDKTVQEEKGKAPKKS